mgnify:CR=1 FL=1
MLTGAAAAAPAAPAPWPALREELQIHGAGANRDGSPAWHVCDPVRNLFFRIGWLEFEFLQRWDLADGAAIAADVSSATTLAAEPDDVEEFIRFLAQHQLLRVGVGQAQAVAHGGAKGFCVGSSVHGGH